ncbi:hypothetical protein BC827DRAFT_1241560 [Russula dissimulans]|nr:hypothetical protein BC827DRAFT_1241560 [Russula dissimulans]
MNSAMCSRHSLAMHFTRFAGSDVEAFDPIIELEQVKHEMAPPTLRKVRQRVGKWMGRRVRQSRWGTVGKYWLSKPALCQCGKLIGVGGRNSRIGLSYAV